MLYVSVVLFVQMWHVCGDVVCICRSLSGVSFRLLMFVDCFVSCVAWLCPSCSMPRMFSEFCSLHVVMPLIECDLVLVCVCGLPTLLSCRKSGLGCHNSLLMHICVFLSMHHVSVTPFCVCIL